MQQSASCAADIVRIQTTGRQCLTVGAESEPLCAERVLAQLPGQQVHHSQVTGIIQVQLHHHGNTGELVGGIYSHSVVLQRV